MNWAILETTTHVLNFLHEIKSRNQHGFRFEPRTWVLFFWRKTTTTNWETFWWFFNYRFNIKLFLNIWKLNLITVLKLIYCINRIQKQVNTVLRVVCFYCNKFYNSRAWLIIVKTYLTNTLPRMKKAATILTMITLTWNRIW